MASTYLSRTFSNTPTSDKICTISTWFKRGDISSEKVLFSWLTASSRDGLRFDGANNIIRLFFNGASSADLQSNSKYRDVSAWYHIVVAIDTTQATASNRVKIWFNNEQVTSFSSVTYPSQNYSIGWGSARACNIGRDVSDTSGIYDGSMSHFHFIDGTAYEPTAFVEYDANGVWKINTSPSVTYGTNGFFILKDGNSVTDQSGNGNNFTVAGGTLTNTEDSPSNVFATGNPLIKGTNGNSNGNNTSTSGQASWESLFGTIASSSGKWYAEFKTGATGTQAGVIDIEQAQTFDIYGGSQSRGWGYDSDGIIYNNGSNTGGTYASFTAGDVIGIALDMDNHKVYFHKNGTWQNSGDPTSGATGTGAKSITSGYDYTFFFGAYNGNMSANFGNGYFGTTAVSSAGTNASGNGIFEYDVPTGYTALSTKGLNL